jgi:hypothetical protein
VLDRAWQDGDVHRAELLAAFEDRDRIALMSRSDDAALRLWAALIARVHPRPTWRATPIVNR